MARQSCQERGVGHTVPGNPQTPEPATALAKPELATVRRTPRSRTPRARMRSLGAVAVGAERSQCARHRAMRRLQALRCPVSFVPCVCRARSHTRSCLRVHLADTARWPFARTRKAWSRATHGRSRPCARAACAPSVRVGCMHACNHPRESRQAWFAMSL